MTARPPSNWRRLLPPALRAMPTGWGPVGTELLVVTPLYVLMALVVTFPLVLNFTGYVIGDLEGDMWKHLWGMWWVRHNLLDLNVLPLHTDLLNYPYGGALFFIDPLNGLLSTPLQLLWQPTVAYNLLVLFNLVLAGMGAYCLARSLSGNPFASFFAGTVYGFSAYMMAYITSGVTEAINIGWIPFFILFFLKMLQTNRVADAVRAGVAFGFATVGCWYYGAFCVLFATFYYAFAVTRLYRRPLRILTARIFGALRPPWSRTVSTAAGVGLLAIFVLWRLPKLVDPFQGDATDFVLVGAALVLATSLVVRLRGGLGERSATAWRALSRLLLPLGALAAEAWVVARMVLHPPEPAQVVVLGAQAAVVASLAALALQHRREHARALQRALRPHGPFLVSLALLALSSMAVWTAFRYFGEAGSGRIVAGAAVVAFLSSWLTLRHARRPFAGEEGDLLADYRRFYGAHAGALLALTLASVPVLRFLLPEVPAVPFLMAWLAVQALLQLGVAGFLSLQARAAAWLDHEGAERFREVAGGFWERMLHRPVIMLLVAAVLVAPPAVEFKRTLNQGNSLVYRKRGDNIELYLSRRFLNVAKLEDYVRPGKENPTRSYTVDKLTRVSYAGWVTLGVVLLGFFLRTRRRLWWFWTGMAGMFAMFSLGPYLYITEDVYSDIASPVYLAFHRWFPLFSQVSIPYRFTAMTMLSLAMLAAFALAELFRTRSRGEQALLAGVLATACLFDVTMFSPAPFPIPLSSVDAPAYCERLASETGEFGLVDVPFQRFKGELLPGEYFFYQMLHRKSIPNKVEGTIPVYVFQNPFTNYLFVLEHSHQNLPPRDRATLEKGLEDLSKFKFRYVVVHDNYLRRSARERLHTMLRFYLGEPERHPENIFLYRIPRQLRFVDGVATSRGEEPVTARANEVAAP